MPTDGWNAVGRGGMLSPGFGGRMASLRQNDVQTRTTIPSYRRWAWLAQTVASARGLHAACSTSLEIHRPGPSTPALRVCLAQRDRYLD